MHTVGDMGKPLSRKILRIELATVYTPGRVIAQSSSKALQTSLRSMRLIYTWSLSWLVCNSGKLGADSCGTSVKVRVAITGRMEPAHEFFRAWLDPRLPEHLIRWTD
jgi:hypothetical protein